MGKMQQMLQTTIQLMQPASGHNSDHSYEQVSRQVTEKKQFFSEPENLRGWEPLGEPEDLQPTVTHGFSNSPVRGRLPLTSFHHIFWGLLTQLYKLGLRDALSTFQRAINLVLRGLTLKKAQAFIDYLLVLG